MISLRRNWLVAICEVGIKIGAPWMDTVFYIKNHKTEIN